MRTTAPEHARAKELCDMLSANRQMAIERAEADSWPPRAARDRHSTARRLRGGQSVPAHRRQRTGEMIARDASGDIALFLPLSSTKVQSTVATSGTKRKEKKPDFSGGEGTIRSAAQSRAKCR